MDVSICGRQTVISDHHQCQVIDHHSAATPLLTTTTTLTIPEQDIIVEKNRNNDDDNIMMNGDVPASSVRIKPSFLIVPNNINLNTPPMSPITPKITLNVPNSELAMSLTVPRLRQYGECPSPIASNPSSGHSSQSSYTSTDISDDSRRISMQSYASSCTDSITEVDSR
jgi:hypothetical protein